MSKHGTTVCCILFLMISFGLWLIVDSTLQKILYYVIFLIPNYFCAEWLAEKFLSIPSLSISHSGFSIVRVIVGAVAVLLLFAIAFGLSILFHALSR